MSSSSTQWQMYIYTSDIRSFEMNPGRIFRDIQMFSFIYESKTMLDSFF